MIQEVSGSVVPQPQLILTPTEDFETSKFLPFMKVFINRIIQMQTYLIIKFFLIEAGCMIASQRILIRVFIIAIDA